MSTMFSYAAVFIFCLPVVVDAHGYLKRCVYSDYLAAHHLSYISAHSLFHIIFNKVQGRGTTSPTNHPGGQLTRVLQGPRAGETTF